LRRGAVRDASCGGGCSAPRSAFSPPQGSLRQVPCAPGRLRGISARSVPIRLCPPIPANIPCIFIGLRYFGPAKKFDSKGNTCRL
jgi:hypothetical protein